MIVWCSSVRRVVLIGAICKALARKASTLPSWMRPRRTSFRPRVMLLLERLSARATSVATRMAKDSSRNVASCATLAFLVCSILSLTLMSCRRRGEGEVV